ncbi:MAG: RDD family protein [Deltaproteobacteria bacterium]|nr:RDD family protein [Deltaproteobacteria bacterium]
MSDNEQVQTNPKAEEEAADDSGLPVAGVGRRFLALMIDALILSITAKIIHLIPLLGSIPLIMFVMFIAYSAWFESSRYRGTLGKIALGIEVGDANGERISLKTALLRAVGKVISYLIMGIGFLFAFFTEHKQALHDLIAKTLVLEMSREAVD